MQNPQIQRHKRSLGKIPEFEIPNLPLFSGDEEILKLAQYEELFTQCLALFQEVLNRGSLQERVQQLDELREFLTSQQNREQDYILPQPEIERVTAGKVRDLVRPELPGIEE